MDNKFAEYNEKDTFNKKIAPRLKEIKEICAIHQIPFFFTCAVSNNEKETNYMTDMVLAGADRTLTENQIGNAILFFNGFEGRIPRDVQKALRVLVDYIMDTNPANVTKLTRPLTEDRIDIIRRFAVKNGRVSLAPEEVEIELGALPKEEEG